LLKRDDDANELVIWDVGLGAASNAMAALHCFEKTLASAGVSALRPMRLVSFEVDLDPLKLALRFASHFPHLRHGAPHEILKSSHWEHESDLCHWKLHHGDFLLFLESSPVPDLIFYDPFSAKTDRELWSAPVFRRLFDHCRPKSAELYTYSAATAVRVALLSAGFYVAAGVGTGPKATTTIGFSHARGPREHAAGANLLGDEWLTRWRRSDSKFPADLAAERRADFEQQLLAHPQFRSL
jgi:queuine tRNA-ribosyltransferase